jgi:hypothetical protein
MSADEGHPLSHAFTLTVWREKVDVDQTEWRGQLKHILTGDTRYFRNWSKLISQLQLMLVELDEIQSDEGQNI